MNTVEKNKVGAFPGGPVVQTLPSKAEGERSIPGQGARITHASRPKNQNVKQKQSFHKFNEDENGLQKNSLKSTKLGKVLGDAGVFLELMFRYSD